MRFANITFVVLVLLTGVVSCSKDEADGPPVDPPLTFLPDTLGTGWTKDSIATSFVINDVFFVNNNTGYITADDGVRQTVDGGQSWTRPNAGGRALYINIAANPAGKVTLVRSGHQGVDNSQNAGTSYDSIFVSTEPTGIPKRILGADVFYSSNSVCYVVGPFDIYKSTDGGASFRNIYQFTTAGGFTSYSSVFFINDLTGWVRTFNGLHKTTDGGQTWTKKLTVERGNIDFPSINVGYISTESGIKKTMDGGDTWLPVNFPEALGGDSFVDVDFVSESTGFISTPKSIFKTTDGGNTWQRVVKMGSKQIIEIHFTDASHGWACGSDGMVLKYIQ